MSYKVTFNTYAILGEDPKTGKRKYGNICQTTEIIYTDRYTPAIEGAINADLEPRNLICDILQIEQVKGKCLI